MENIDDQKVLEKGIVTVKRHLDNARNSDYNEPAGKKKAKKQWSKNWKYKYWDLKMIK